MTSDAFFRFGGKAAVNRAHSMRSAMFWSPRTSRQRLELVPIIGRVLQRRFFTELPIRLS
jgi:hypothetical protein